MLSAKSVTRDVKIQDVDGEVFKVVVQTKHETAEVGTVWANTAVHDQVFARRIGGVRFVRSEYPGDGPERLTELGELAASMTWKSPLSGIPADGEKSVVYCPGGLPSPERMAEILAEHLEVLREADPGVIFGPDINCNEVVMQRLADVHGAGNHVSGLLQGKGGLSIDGQGYTARGVEAAVVSTARRLGWDLSKMKAVIQGFGAVGAHTGRNLRRHGVAIQAVSTVHGALIATTDEGLDVEEIFVDWKHFREAGRMDDAFKRFLETPPRGARVAGADDIWAERAEIFVPAARTDVLAVPEEVEEARAQGKNGVIDVARFVEQTGVKVVVEGANHPVTDDGESYLESKGVFILPDYLINCGGLIGCWADWVYRKELQQGGKAGEEWYHRLNESAPRYVSRIVEQNMPMVLERTGDRPGGMRKATHELATARRVEVLEKYRRLGGDARRCMDDLLD